MAQETATDRVQSELEGELSDAVRATANETSTTVAINALRNVLRDMEGDLTSRDDLTPEDEEALMELVAWAGGQMDESKHFGLMENFNTAVDALDMDHMEKKKVPTGWRA